MATELNVEGKVKDFGLSPTVKGVLFPEIGKTEEELGKRSTVSGQV